MSEHDGPVVPETLVEPTGRPSGSINDADAALLDAYAGAIDQALDGFYSWSTTEPGWGATADSPLMQERWLLSRQYGPGGDWDGRDAGAAVHLCSIYLVSAAQHLEGVRALLLARQVIVPLAPLVRSIFEVAGRVAWLLEPLEHRPGRVAFLNVRVRAARLAVVRVEDLTRAKAVAQGFGHPEASKRGQELHDLRKKEIPARFAPSEILIDKRGKLFVAGQSVPGFSQAGELYARLHKQDWSATGVYDQLSNATHPTGSAMLELMSEENEQGQRRFELESAEYPAKLARFGLVALLRTWSTIVQYLGQDPSVAHDYFDVIDSIEPEAASTLKA